jgi:TonB family protein
VYQNRKITHGCAILMVIRPILSCKEKTEMTLALLLLVTLTLENESTGTVSPGAPTTSTQDVRIGNAGTVSNAGVILPKLVTYTRPQYTDEARRRGIEGVVTVQASFDVFGNFKVLRLLKGLGHGLDESALAALLKWRFTPAYREGRAVTAVTQIDVRFTVFDDPQWLAKQNRPPEFWERDFGRRMQRVIERWETH